MVSPGSQLSIAARMSQSDQQHQQHMRALALDMAVQVVAVRTSEIRSVMIEAAAATHRGATTTDRLELLANHFLSFIETGKFQNVADER